METRKNEGQVPEGKEPEVQSQQEPEGKGAEVEGQEADGGGAEEQGTRKDGGGGDKTVALRKERDRRRQLSEDNEKLRAQLARMQSADDGEDIDLSEFAITDEEVENGSAAALNQKIRGMIEKATSSMSKRLSGQLLGKQSLERTLGEYEIFSDTEDPELAADAMSAAIREIEALPKTERTPVKVGDAIEAVAKRYSRYRVERHQSKTGDGGGGTDPLPPGGGGTGEAAHMRNTPKRPESAEEAVAMSRDMARRKAESMGLRWD